MTGRKQTYPARTKEECILNLQCIAKELGHAPTIKEYNNSPIKITYAHIIIQLFGKFSIALKAAGLKPYWEQHTPEELLESLRIVSKDIGHSPTIPEYEAHPQHMCTESTLTKYFGSYCMALKRAGLDPTYTIHHRNRSKTVRHYTCHHNKKKVLNKRKTILANVKKIAKEIKRTPTLTEIMNHKKYKVSATLIYKYFSGIEELLQELGYTKENIIHSRYYAFGYTDEELLEDLYDTMLKHPNMHCLTDLLNITKHSSSTYASHFGTMLNSFKAVYLRYGLNFYYFDKLGKVKSIADSCKKSLEKEVTERIQRLSKEIKHVPSLKEYMLIEKWPSRATIYRNLGTWDKVLDKAGFKNVKSYNQSYTNEQIIKMIQDTAKIIGKVPTFKEYINIQGVPSRPVISRRFGPWNNALIAAGLKEE